MKVDRTRDYLRNTPVGLLTDAGLRTSLILPPLRLRKPRFCAATFANPSERPFRPFVFENHKYMETLRLRASGAPESYKLALHAPRFANRTENRACGPEPPGTECISHSECWKWPDEKLPEALNVYQAWKFLFIGSGKMVVSVFRKTECLSGVGSALI